MGGYLNKHGLTAHLCEFLLFTEEENMNEILSFESLNSEDSTINRPEERPLDVSLQFAPEVPTMPVREDGSFTVPTIGEWVVRQNGNRVTGVELKDDGEGNEGTQQSTGKQERTEPLDDPDYRETFEPDK